MKNLLKFSCFSLLWICVTLVPNAFAQLDEKDESIKVGLQYFVHNSPTFTITDNTGESETTVELSENLIGTLVTIEYIILSNFGLGVKAGTLTRSTETELGSNDTFIEDSVTVAMIEARSYFFDHIRNGFKPYLGVSTGTYSATTSVIIKSSTGSNTSANASSSISSSNLSLGFDAIFGFMAVRLEISLTNGSQSIVDGLGTNQDVRYDYAGTSVGIGAFSFF